MYVRWADLRIGCALDRHSSFLFYFSTGCLFLSQSAHKYARPLHFSFQAFSFFRQSSKVSLQTESRLLIDYIESCCSVPSISNGSNISISCWRKKSPSSNVSISTTCFAIRNWKTPFDVPTNRQQRRAILAITCRFTSTISTTNGIARSIIIISTHVSRSVHVPTPMWRIRWKMSLVRVFSNDDANQWRHAIYHPSSKLIWTSDWNEKISIDTAWRTCNLRAPS